MANTIPVPVGKGPAFIPLASAGKPYATVVVAASNSTAADAANADYVCDGTADEVEINQAIAACLTGSTHGGRVILLEGTYVTAAAIATLQGANAYYNVRIQGQGRGTRIVPASGTFIVIDLGSSNGQVADLFIDGGAMSATSTGVKVSSASNGTISNVEVSAMPGTGFLGAAEGHFLRCYATGCTIGFSLTAALCTITDCHVRQASGNGIVIEANYASVLSCLIDSCSGDGLWADSWTDARIVGNISRNNTGSGFNIDQAATYTELTANISEGNGGDGIKLYTSDAVCVANVSLSNTGSGISLNASSADNLVQSNKCRSNGTGITNAGSTNIVAHNDVKGNTAAFTDTGTGTVIWGGNRT